MNRSIMVFGRADVHECDGAMSYSTSSRRWTRLPQMPAVRQGAAAAALGTGNSFCFVVCANVWRTDPELAMGAMRTVPALTHFPPGLLPLIASYLGPDSIFVTGGYGGHEGYEGHMTYAATSFCYSLDAHTWKTDVPVMGVTRTAMATVVIGGRMMVFGGRNHNSVMASCEAFDPTTNKWSPLPPMPTPRATACAAAWEGRAFVFGGHHLYTALSSVDCFDPTLNRWSAIAPMNFCREGAAAVTIPRRGLLVMGGCHRGCLQQSAELYDFLTTSWTTMPWQLPTPLCDFSAHVLDGVLYIIGGNNVRGAVAECWSMDLSLPVWSPLSPLPTALFGIASVAF